jgi:AAA ATPase domain
MRDLNQLFVPRSAIRSDKVGWFSGRKGLIGDCLNALGGEGTSLILYGERGIGKTSLAWQIMEILAGSHKVYQRQDLMHIGSDKNYKCVWLECKDTMESIEAVLVNLLRPQDEPFSLSQQFKNVYEDKDFLESSERKYSFNLFSLINVEWKFRTDPGEKRFSSSTTDAFLTPIQKLYAFLEDVLNTIARKNPEADLIIFLDEVDRLQNKDRLGSLIKNTSRARFALVGVADNMRDLVEDHASVDRKLMAAAFEVPTLSSEEIKWIFQRAEKVSKGDISFSNNFVNMAVEYSFGFPFLAQQFGFHAVKNALIRERTSGKPFSVSEIDFNKAVEEITTFHLNSLGAKQNAIEDATDNSTRVSILTLLWKKNTWMSVEQIRREVPPEQQPYIGPQIRKLRNIGILKENSDKLVKIIDPITRILIKCRLDLIQKGIITL